VKAIILAAGLGTRLRPITETKPKALVEAGGVTLLEIAIKTLRAYGFYDVIINVHHFADQIVEFIKNKDFKNINISISDERDQLMDTGGGIKKASWFFDDNVPFVVYNVDVITDINLKEMFIFHQQKKGLATLAVQDRDSSRYLMFDENDVLCGWGNKQTGKEAITRGEKVEGIYKTGFSGIHVIDPLIFDMMEENKPFSIVDLYLRVANQHNIFAYPHKGTYWKDAGTKESLDEATPFIKGLMRNKVYKLN